MAEAAPFPPRCVSAICLCTTLIRELHHHKIKGNQLSVDSQNTHQLNRNCFLTSQKASKWELCVTAFDTSGKESASFEEKPSTPTSTTAVPNITSPTPGSTLTISSATFQWSAGSSMNKYWLRVETIQEAKDLYNQSTGTSPSATISGLPLNGKPVFVTLE